MTVKFKATPFEIIEPQEFIFNRPIYQSHVDVKYGKRYNKDESLREILKFMNTIRKRILKVDRTAWMQVAFIYDTGSVASTSMLPVTMRHAKSIKNIDFAVSSNAVVDDSIVTELVIYVLTDDI